MDCVRKEKKKMDVNDDMTVNRGKWKKKRRCPIPNRLG